MRLRIKGVAGKQRIRQAIVRDSWSPTGTKASTVDWLAFAAGLMSPFNQWERKRELLFARESGIHIRACRRLPLRKLGFA